MMHFVIEKKLFFYNHNRRTSIFSSQVISSSNDFDLEY